MIATTTQVNRLNPEHSRLLPLKGSVQPYAWGKPGSESRIFSMLSEPATGPLAEYWIGVHPRGMAQVISSDGTERALGEQIAERPEYFLGQTGARHFSGRLPFLLKILSINPDFGLSIQAHPNKVLAAYLREKDPERYPDANHKPEIAIPLTRLTLLKGFRPLSEISEFFQRYPALAEIVGEEARQELLNTGGATGASTSVTLKALYSAILRADEASVARCVAAIRSRIETSGNPGAEETHFLRLNAKHGDTDRGLLSIFVLNLVRVEPGKAIFTGPNIAHAYLDGDLVECMADSDNVVRAGLTNKFMDVETLIEMLEYVPEQPSVITPQRDSDGFDVFQSQAEEFEVSMLPRDSTSSSLTSNSLPMVLMMLGESCVVSCQNTRERIVLRDGGALFIPPDSGIFDLSRTNSSLIRVRPNI